MGWTGSGARLGLVTLFTVATQACEDPAAPFDGVSVAAWAAASTAAPPPVPAADAQAVLARGSEDLSGAVADASPVDPDVAVVFRGDRADPRIALTFDDGPSKENTPRILAVLRRLEVRATFFVEGRRVERFPALTRQIVREGHEIAIHGWSHASFRGLMPSEITEEIEQTRQVIEQTTGLSPRLLRPPFGRYADSALALFSDLGVDVVLWSVDSHDWEEEWPQIAWRATQAQAGDIVLLHDRIPATADAVLPIVQHFRELGLQPSTVSEVTGLAPYRPPETRPADIDCVAHPGRHRPPP